MIRPELRAARAARRRVVRLDDREDWEGFMTRKEAAVYLRYTDKTIDRFIRLGLLRARKFRRTGAVRVYADSVWALADDAVDMGDYDGLELAGEELW